MNKDPEVEFVDVTPELAVKWLQTDVSNRRLKATAVEANARDIKAGKWNMTGEGVKFDTEGRLIDGQHRLQAVIRAGVSARMMILHGLEPEARMYMDTGVKRSAADMLSMGGHSTDHSVVVAAVVRMALSIRTGLSHNGRAATNHEIADFVGENPEVVKWVGKSRGYKNIKMLPTTLGYVTWRLHKINEEQASKFFSDLETLEWLKQGDPQLVLIRKLEGLASSGRTKDAKYKLEQVAMTFMAWNALRRGEPMDRLVVRYIDGKLRMPEPE